MCEDDERLGTVYRSKNSDDIDYSTCSPLTRILYCCALVLPGKARGFGMLGNVQRSLTVRINSVELLNYWDRLNPQKPYLWKYRHMRYIIICVLKIMEILVPNLNAKTILCWNDRLGRLYKISAQKSRVAVGNIRENSKYQEPPSFLPITGKYKELYGKTRESLQKTSEQLPPRCTWLASCATYTK